MNAMSKSIAPDGGAEESTSQWVIVEAQQHFLGLEARQVREVVRLEKITPAPSAPDWVEGLVELRGAVLPVVELARRLGIKNESSRHEMRQVVFVDCEGFRFGFIVDRILETRYFRRSDFHSPPPGSQRVGAEFLRGVVHWQGKLLLALELEHLIDLKGLQEQWGNASSSQNTALATGTPEEVMTEMICFELAGETYGLPLQELQEILKPQGVIRVPRSAPQWVGLLNLRGELLAVLDVRQKLGMPPESDSPESRIMIVRQGEHALGLKVDRVHEIVRLPLTHWEPPPEGLPESRRCFLKGCCRDGERLVIWPDLAKILA